MEAACNTVYTETMHLLQKQMLKGFNTHHIGKVSPSHSHNHNGERHV